MFSPPVSNPGLQRTLQPLYAVTQATPWAGQLDPDWDYSFDILPGTVMARIGGDVFTPYIADGTMKPFGLSEFFVAPSLGVDEVTPTGANNFTVWVLNADSEFNVFAPAFDSGGDWTVPTDGSRVFLAATETGLLTPVTGAGQILLGNAVAELIAAPAANQIQIRGLPVTRA